MVVQSERHTGRWRLASALLCEEAWSDVGVRALYECGPRYTALVSEASRSGLSSWDTIDRRFYALANEGLAAANTLGPLWKKLNAPAPAMPPTTERANSLGTAPSGAAASTQPSSGRISVLARSDSKTGKALTAAAAANSTSSNSSNSGSAVPSTAVVAAAPAPPLQEDEAVFANFLWQNAYGQCALQNRALPFGGSVVQSLTFEKLLFMFHAQHSATYYPQTVVSTASVSALLGPAAGSMSSSSSGAGAAGSTGLAHACADLSVSGLRPIQWSRDAVVAQSVFHAPAATALIPAAGVISAGAVAAPDSHALSAVPSFCQSLAVHGTLTPVDRTYTALVNSSSAHFSHGVLMGGARVYHPLPLADSIRSVGGVSVLFPLIPHVKSSASLHRVLLLIAFLLRANPKNHREMEAGRGYHILSYLLEQHYDLLDDKAVTILMSIVGLSEDCNEGEIHNRTFFEAFVMNYRYVWARAPDR